MRACGSSNNTTQYVPDEWCAPGVVSGYELVAGETVLSGKWLSWWDDDGGRPLSIHGDDRWRSLYANACWCWCWWACWWAWGLL